MIITNLPDDLTRAWLKRLFGEFGEVWFAYVRDSEPSGAGPGAHGGCGPSRTGCVAFTTEEAALRAVEQADGAFLGGHQLRVRGFRSAAARVQ